jgi:hypothetical protein
MKDNWRPHTEISVVVAPEVSLDLKGKLIDQLPICVKLDCDGSWLPRTTLWVPKRNEFREPSAPGSSLQAIEIDRRVELTIGINRCRF